MSKKILILGHARHGKDTVAEFLLKNFGYTFESSSVAAARIFLFDVLKDKYGYATFEDCFNDRVNHRAEWHSLICDYNRKDKSRLAKGILKDSNIYVGMRSDLEVFECQKQKLFNVIMGVYNPNLPLEPKESFDIDIWEHCDFVIPNAGTLKDLEQRIIKLNGIL